MGIGDTISSIKSYAKTGTGLLKNPTHLLGKVKALSFLSGSTLSRMQGREDPLLSCFWDVQLPDVKYWGKDGYGESSIFDILGGLSSALPTSVTSTFNNAYQKVQGWAKDVGLNKEAGQIVQLPSEYVESITLPTLSYETDTIARAGIDYKFASKASVTDLTMQLYVDDTCKSLAYIQNWLHLVSGATDAGLQMYTGFYRCPGEYKHDIQVDIHDVNDNTVYSCKLVGVFPTSMEVGDLSSDDGERIVITVTFSVDEIFYDGFDYQANGLSRNSLANLTSGFMKQGIKAMGSTVSGIIGN